MEQAPKVEGTSSGTSALSAGLGAWVPIETAPRGSGESGPSNVTHPDYVKPPKILLWTQEGPVVGYYSLEEMKPEETIDESKYETQILHGGVLYIDKEYEEEHYFIHKNPNLNGKRIF